MATSSQSVSSPDRNLLILREIQAVASLEENIYAKEFFKALPNDEHLLEFLEEEGVIALTYANKISLDMKGSRIDQKGSTMGLMLFNYATANFTLDSLTVFCERVEHFGRTNCKPKLCIIAKAVMDIVKPAHPEHQLADERIPSNGANPTPAPIGSTFAEVTSNDSTASHDGGRKMQILNNIYCSRRDSSATVPMEFKRLPCLKLEDKFDNILLSLKAKLCQLSSTRQLFDFIALKCYRHRADRDELPVLDTSEAAYACIVKESDLFDRVVVHQVIAEMENLELKTKLKDFEDYFTSFSGCHTTLTSISHSTTYLQPCCEKTIIDTRRLAPPECQTVAQDLTSKDDTESTDDVTAPGPSRSTRSPSIGDQTPPPKRSKSSIDSTVLLPYEDHFAGQLRSLGVCLEVKDASGILASQAPLSDKYIEITDKWMQRTPNPTWKKFCSCLSKYKDFTRVRTLIEREQNVGET